MADLNNGNRLYDAFVKDGKILRTPMKFVADNGLRPTDEWLIEQGYYGYLNSEPPAYDNSKEKIVEVPLNELTPIDGVITRRWRIVELSAEEKDESIRWAWISLREGRNALLSQTDWTQLADSTVDKEAWAEYRQKLRDLPSITTDPFNVPWPTQPFLLEEK